MDGAHFVDDQKVVVHNSVGQRYAAGVGDGFWQNGLHLLRYDPGVGFLQRQPEQR